jgi:glyoxylase-like metal-dependent hydrolase (beta-lactamase superfamily II)
MKKALVVVACLLGILLIAAGVVLIPPHLQIRKIEPDLPSVAEIQAAVATEQGPVGISAIETSTQRFGDRAAGNAVFVIEWDDGRRFMIDAGMDEAASREFAKTLALMGADEKLDYRGTVSQVLGEQVMNVRGVGFSHLHIDHTQGIRAFCEQRGRGAAVYQTAMQASVRTLHTRESAELVRNSCLKAMIINGEGIQPVKDFPGLAMLNVGGHTPGSTVFFAKVRDKLWILSGDISNDKTALLNNQGKSFIYSYLIVPENTRQLAKIRPWLAALDARDDTEVMVAHDDGALMQSAIPKLPRVIP